MLTKTPHETQSPEVGAAVSGGPGEPGGPGGPLRLGIEGMSCAGCVGKVERALGAVPTATEVRVNLLTEQAEIDFAGPPGPERIAAALAAVQATGFGLQHGETVLQVEGMSCASCVGHVEAALRALTGVAEVRVNLATEQAHVRFVQGAVSVRALITAVESTGYGARPLVADAPAGDLAAARREQDARALRRSLLVSAALSVPVFVLEMGSHIWPAFHHWTLHTIGAQRLWYLQFALTALVLLGPGRRFFLKGVPALLRRAPDMNSLVVLGTGAAFGYSVVATFAPGALPDGSRNVYYEAAAVIVTLILLGRYLEGRAKGRTGRAIERLVGLRVQHATVLRGGEAHEVPLAEVVPGDMLQARPGERVAVDGEVTEGSAYVDESMITGEPVPVHKAPGARVVGGTVNGAGSFTYRATHVGADTVLSRIIAMVAEAQGGKLPIQALVDRVTMWFVPAVMAAATLTFLLWLWLGPAPALTLALVNAVAVLIIACPCAMGLATPTSIMVGTGRAADMGVLFRRGEALQALRDAAVVAVDKTGTLTLGRPTLTDFTAVDGFEEATVLPLLAAVEARSEHPIAAAIVDGARSRGLSWPAAERFEARPGHGVGAVVDGHRVQLGSARQMALSDVDIGPLSVQVAALAKEGKSALYAAVDGRLAAALAVSDPLKDSSVRAIEALHTLGLKVAMVTGDARPTAEATAAQLGIDEVVAEVLPEGKVEAVRALRARFGPVAFVGDGINDAPALAEADVGLALGTGTDVAIESADVVLMSGDLRGVPNALALSQATIRNIRQNLFWAFAYNASLVPLAAGALYPINGVLLSPIFAASAMALSSVFVLGNALRLRAFRPPVALG